MRRLFIDGSHLAGRCWATLQEMCTTDGRWSGALYGFLKGLSWVKYDQQIEYEDTVVCWDHGRAQGRLDLYPEYKAGRYSETPTPEEELRRKAYVQQLGIIRSAVRNLGCRQLRVQGCEADDLVSLFATDHASLSDGISVIYSGDKDFHQLVSDKIWILDPKAGLLREPDILAKWKVTNTLEIPILKSIIGDPSDNIKGIHGVGPARAEVILRYLRDEPITDKEVKWIKLYQDNLDIVRRNYKLMALPRRFVHSFYDEGQKMEAVEQYQQIEKRDEAGFVEICKSWELNSILESLDRW